MTPTELMLRFDHRIQHLLMDEFQDTALSQIRLFERLISGWQYDDGITDDELNVHAPYAKKTCRTA